MSTSTAVASRPDGPSRGGHAGVVKSAGRVLRILEFFDRHRGAANAHTVSVALGLPHSSASALLRSLVAVGYMHYDRQARMYRPTLRVAMLGSHWIAPRLAGDGILPRLLASLAERAGGHALLATRNSDQAEIVFAVGPDGMAPSSPNDVPLVRPGLGHTLLAAMPDQEIRGMLHRLNAAAAAAGQPTLPAAGLLSTLAVIRAQGFAETEEEGQALLAVPLALADERGPHAIALLLPRDIYRATRESLVVLIRDEVRHYLGSSKPALRWPSQAGQEGASLASVAMSRATFHQPHVV